MALIFMACTSAMSAQLIAVSSIFTYDIYKTYINRKASGKKLIYVSHMSVLGFGLVMSASSIGLFYIGISMGYLYSMMGIIISSAVIPGALTLLWDRQSKLAVCLSPPLGFLCCMGAWLITTKAIYGSISVQTSGSDTPMLVGNVVALFSPVLFVPILSLIAPDSMPYDFVSMRAIERVNDGPSNIHEKTFEETEREIALLTRKSRFARILAVTVSVCFIIIWPWPMYGSSYIFSKPFFTAWIIIGVVWMLISFIVVSIYPLIEGRQTIISVCKSLYIDLTSIGRYTTKNHEDHVQMTAL